MKMALPLKGKISVALFFFLFLWVILHFNVPPYQGRVIVTAATGSQHMMQVFWATSEHQYAPSMSSIAQLYPGVHEYHRTFSPAGMLRKVRIDPTTQADADITIHRVRVALGSEVIFDISGDHMISALSGLQQLKTVPSTDDKGLALISTGSDPYFELDVADAVLNHWWKRELPNGLAALCIVFLFWMILHYITTERYLERSHDTYPQTRMQWLYWGCIFFAAGFFFVQVIPVQLHEQWWMLHWISWAYVIGVILFGPIFLLHTRAMVNAARQIPCRFDWLCFALPSILVWSFYLAAFWPGSMSPDFFDQWRQLHNGHLKDWHPAFHTITLWLITRIYLSPALVAAAQIFTLASVVGWVLSVFLKYGVSRKVLWCTSILCALWPINGLMVITLWKDVAYSIVLLVLAIYILEIVMEGAKWFDSKRNLFFLVLILLFVTLYRHNGMIPAFLTPVILVMFYPSRWKRIVLVLLLTVACHGLIKGPLYRALDVRMEGPVVKVIQHLQKDFFRTKTLAGSKKQVIGIEGGLSKEQSGKEPSLSLVGGGIDRIYSASALWRVKPMTFFHKRIEQVNFWEEKGQGGSRIRYVNGNHYNIVERSFWPKATPWLYAAFDESRQNPLFFWMWRPAVYLYALITLSLIVSFRTGKKVYLVLFPALASSLPFFLLVIHKSIFRYHYPVVLIAIVLFLRLLFFGETGSELDEPSVDS